MSKNKKIIYMIVGVIVLAGTFYGGMTYGGNNVRAAIMSRGLGLGQNTTFAGARGTRGVGAFGGATTGQVVAKDSQSITVSTADGGSKIILINNNTPVSKQASGSMTDIVVGTEISITGTTNQDGSVSAQSVQIRPKMQAAAPTPVGQ